MAEFPPREDIVPVTTVGDVTLKKQIEELVEGSDKPVQAIAFLEVVPRDDGIFGIAEEVDNLSFIYHLARE